jgi:2'-5' RNA ligase
VRAKRLFVSLDLPKTIARLLADLDPHVSGLRWVSPEQMHLTLAFFGNVGPELEEKLRNQLESISFRLFFLPLQGFGIFPRRGPLKVLWLGVGRGHPHLFQLHKKLADAALAAGLEADLRPWHPHITVARCKGVSASTVRPFLREHAESDLGLIPIDRLHLKSSLLTPAGSIYTSELTVCAQ